MQCVRCKLDLVPERYEGTEIDRCPRCQGAWLDEGELTRIVDTVDVKIPAEVVRDTLAVAFKGVPQDEARSIERCPKCSAAMEAINYDYGSGIVLDRCPDGHGTWLDGGELEKVQAHHEHWVDQAKRSRAEWAEFARSVAGRRDEAADESRRRDLRPTRYLVNTILRRFLGG
jgi:Zn-finger nucleic acid-binding protein